MAARLRDAIFAGELMAGDPLPTERTLAEEFRVSRPTIREALRALEAQRLVVSNGRRISRVVTPLGPSGPVSDAIESMLRLHQVDIDGLIELRITIESAALQKAASVVNSPALQAAAEYLRQMKQRDLSLARLDELDVSFHLALVRASGNEASYVVMLALRHAIQMYILQMLERMPSRRRVIRRLAAEHDAIFRAVRRRDGEAAAALLQAHVSGFYEDAKRTERVVQSQRSRPS